jgi:hypothetical protein
MPDLVCSFMVQFFKNYILILSSFLQLGHANDPFPLYFPTYAQISHLLHGW